MTKQLITIQDLAKLKIAGDPQMSPDGQRVLFTVKTTDVEKVKYWTHLWLGEVGSHTAREFTFGEVGDAWPRWSPDGGQIAFIRTKDKKSQVWMVPAGGGEARPLTQLPDGSLAELRWSPDGQALAFTFRPTHPDWTRDAGKAREEKGKSSPPRVIRRPHFRMDGAGFQDERQHIWVCDANTGETRQVTRGEYDDASPAWSPDSKWLAFISNRSQDPDRLLYKEDIFVVSPEGGKVRRVATPVGYKSAVAWSPNGRQLAYIGSQVGTDPWAPYNDRLWVVSKQGGNAHCLTQSLDRTIGNATLGDSRDAAPTVPIWSPDGRRIVVPISDSGSVNLYAIDVASQEATPLTRGAIDIAGATADASGRRWALVIDSPTEPTEVFIGRLRNQKLDLEPLTRLNTKWLKGVQLSRPEEFWVRQPDGARVQGWILRPPQFRRGVKYPLLVYVHGGPHSQYGNVFFHELQWHAARGYVVVYSNPRGSNGRDEAFGAAIHRRWGTVDFEDVMAVADYAEALPYVDKTRTAIAGGSYGGYMTNWVVGHTNRFQVAVTDRCVSNFISMVGTTDMPAPPNSYWPGNPWGKDFQEGWQMSPIKYVDNVRTPTLIIHSEGDLRCPISQAEEWFTALKWLKQEVVLVRYPRETSHGLSRGGPIDLRFDRLQRIGDWLDNHLKPRRRAKRRNGRW